MLFENVFDAFTLVQREHDCSRCHDFPNNRIRKFKDVCELIFGEILRKANNHSLDIITKAQQSAEKEVKERLLESIAHGTPTSVNIKEETIMAGLSCGEVSEIAWEILSPTLSHCMSIGDQGIPKIMRLFADGSLGGGLIEAGECAASGLAALLIARTNPRIWDNLNFDEQSDVLLIGTEGATDPILYRKLISGIE